MYHNCYWCEFAEEHVHYYYDNSSLFECLKPNNEENTEKWYDNHRKVKEPTIKRKCFDMKRKRPSNHPEYKRLSAKKEGIELAIQYMFDSVKINRQVSCSQ